MQLQHSIGTLACHAGLAAEGLGRAAHALVLGQRYKGLAPRHPSATAGASQ
jgi:hypothetical protein